MICRTRWHLTEPTKFAAALADSSLPASREHRARKNFRPMFRENFAEHGPHELTRLRDQDSIVLKVSRSTFDCIAWFHTDLQCVYFLFIPDVFYAI